MSEDSANRPAEILGVAPDADVEEINLAFRRVAKDIHPDVNDDPDATERFAKLRQARADLLDQAKSADEGSEQSTGSRPTAGVDTSAGKNADVGTKTDTGAGATQSSDTDQDWSRADSREPEAGAAWTGNSNFKRQQRTTRSRYHRRADYDERSRRSTQGFGHPSSQGGNEGTESKAGSTESHSARDKQRPRADSRPARRLWWGLGRAIAHPRRSARPLDVLIALTALLGFSVIGLELSGWQLSTVTAIPRIVTEQGGLRRLLSAVPVTPVTVGIGVLLVAGMTFVGVVLWQAIVDSNAQTAGSSEHENVSTTKHSRPSARSATRSGRSEVRSIGWIAGFNLIGLVPFIIARVRGTSWGGFEFVVHTAIAVAPGVILFALLGAATGGTSPLKSRSPQAPSSATDEYRQPGRSIKSSLDDLRPQNGSVPGALAGVGIALALQLVTWNGIILAELLLGIAPPVATGPWISAGSAQIWNLGFSPLGDFIIGLLMTTAILGSLAALFWSFPIVVRSGSQGRNTRISVLCWNLLWVVPLAIVSGLLVAGVGVITLPTGIRLLTNDIAILVFALPALTIGMYLLRGPVKRLLRSASAR